MSQAASFARYVFAFPRFLCAFAALSWASCSSPIPPTVQVTLTDWPPAFTVLTIHPSLPGYSRVPADFQVSVDQPSFLYDLPGDVSGTLTLSVALKDTTKCKAVSASANVTLGADTTYPQELSLALKTVTCPSAFPGLQCQCP